MPDLPSDPPAWRKPRVGRLILVVVGLLILLVAVPLGVRMAVSRLQHRSYLNVLLGCVRVDGVEESGFSFQEYHDSEPFRWTNGAAKLVIPIDTPPRRVWVRVYTLRHEPTPVALEILIDGTSVFEGEVPLGQWERTFDLGSHPFSEQVMIELLSDTFVPQGVMDEGTNTDTRVLGVEVRGIMLQHDEK
jgi:hypothetical protein